MTRTAKATLVISAVSILIAAACAVNPATGKRQIMLVSEGQEIEMGRQYDETIVAQMGLYDDDSLQEYVQSLGERLAADSERPHLDWQFRVVDDPIVNAFALPGGYIYITRGIMAHLDNEAELATVVGHEIGHVTARHSANQMSKGQLAQLGLGLGSMAAPEYAQRFGGLAETAMSLAFLKFGRDDERQADDLGLRYMLATGYDPRPASGVFDMLARVSEAGGGGGIPAWASTHPAPENREGRIRAQIDALDASFGGRPVGTADYQRRIDGLVFGADPQQGYFEGDVFYQPEMAFQIAFPEGWKHANQRAAVVGVSAEEDGAVQLTIAGEKTAAAALAGFFRQEGVTKKGEPMGSIHGLRTAGDGFTAPLGGGNVEGRVGFVEHEGLVFQLLGYATEAAWPQRERTIRSSLASFDRLTDRRYLDVEPKRLKIVPVARPESLAAFAKRNGSTVPVETLELLNGLEPGETLEPGRSYKVVTGGELP